MKLALVSDEVEPDTNLTPKNIDKESTSDSQMAKNNTAGE